MRLDEDEQVFKPVLKGIVSLVHFSILKQINVFVRNK